MTVDRRNGTLPRWRSCSCGGSFFPIVIVDEYDIPEEGMTMLMMSLELNGTGSL